MPEITRRTLIGFALSLVGWRPKADETAVQTVRERPWDHLCDWERDGMYCDYVAWEQWMGQRCYDQSGNELYYVFDSMGLLERIGLYSIMADVADGPCHKRSAPVSEVPF